MMKIKINECALFRIHATFAEREIAARLAVKDWTGVSAEIREVEQER